MKTSLLAAALLLAPSLAVAQAGGTSDLAVAESAVAASVVDRQPQGRAATFSSSVGHVSYWTRITGAQPGTRIEHVWYWGEQEMARVPLEVDGPTWRTWSQKNIMPEWAGEWRVDVVKPDGTVLHSARFTVSNARTSTH